jgi:hypothetical protein
MTPLSPTTLGSTQLFLDNQVLIDASRTEADRSGDAARHIAQFVDWSGTGTQVHTAAMSLVAGDMHTVRIEYATDLPEQSWFYVGQLRFGWQAPADVVTPWIAEAAALAGDPMWRSSWSATTRPRDGIDQA